MNNKANLGASPQAQLLHQQRAQTFFDLHQQHDTFVMPNAWDAGSAKMLHAAGFSVLATTSAGVAFAQGRPDNGFCAPEQRIQRDAMLAQVAAIVEAVPVPVNADLESGYGDTADAVADTVKATIACGAVGVNIEDYSGDEKAPLFDIALALERISAARQAIASSAMPIVLTARCDAVNIGLENGLSEAIDRVNRFYEAGADCLFVPGVSTWGDISLLVKEVAAPINIVMGLSSSDLNLEQLKDLGVRRVSVGGSLARSMYFHLRSAAQEMLQAGTFSYASKQIPQGELNAIFESNTNASSATELHGLDQLSQ